ncbi:MAG TPA: hypothetical protein PKU78_02095, partial [Candidatus Dojkabacteria bacterium]|nr:hypothetical protein [Candidatus Dojkabacteria bacterium]
LKMDQFYLTYLGKKISYDDNTTLDVMKLKNLATIELKMRLKGGVRGGKGGAKKPATVMVSSRRANAEKEEESEEEEEEEAGKEIVDAGEKEEKEPNMSIDISEAEREEARRARPEAEIRLVPNPDGNLEVRPEEEVGPEVYKYHSQICFTEST